MSAGEGTFLKELTSPRTRAPIAPPIMRRKPMGAVEEEVAMTQETAPTARMTANIAAVRMMTSS